MTLHGVHTKLFVAAAVATAGFAASKARADAINFSALPSQQVPSLDVGGVTISGSNLVDVDPSYGLAIKGGLPGIGIGGPDATIDPTESVTFRFDGAMASNVVLSWQYIGAFENPSTIAAGEAIITAFGTGLQSLGAIDLTPGFNISAAFGDQPISSFTIEPEGNTNAGADFSLSGLTFTTVPEPASLLCWAASSLVLSICARKSRKSTTKPDTTSLIRH